MSLQNLQVEIAQAILMNDHSNELVHPAAHLSIYQNNMQTALTRALTSTYPMIVKLIGEDFFHLTAKEYIASYPSLSGDLNDYGAYFSDFLAEYQPLHGLVYLAEVAKFEWACHRISNQIEPAPFDIKALEKISPDYYAKLHFVLSPLCEIFAFRFPLLRIIALCKNETTDAININEGGINLLIHRKQHNIGLITLSSGEYTFLSSLHENQPLSLALDIALDADPLFKLDEKLPIWIKNRIIVDCTFL